MAEILVPSRVGEDVGAIPRTTTVLGTALVLWRAPGGAPAAAEDRCPHRDGRLSLGWTCDGRIVCPYHGWQFRADGSCAVVPQTPEVTSFPAKFAIEPVRAEERHGVVWVCLGDPARPIPEVPGDGVPGWRCIREFDEQWEAPAARLMENSFDPAHTVFVHRATFGDGRRPDVDVPSVERTPGGMVIRSDLSVTNHDLSRAITGETSELTIRSSETELFAPFVRVLASTYRS